VVELRDAVRDWAVHDAELRSLDSGDVGEWNPDRALDELKLRSRVRQKKDAAWVKVDSVIGSLDEEFSGMTLALFQSEAVSVSHVGATPGDDLASETLGLCGEVGALASLARKVVMEEGGVPTDEDRSKFLKGIGEVMLGTAVLCRELGFDMDEVANWILADKRKAKPGLGD
jgi:hypothetical protein